ncbi:cyclic nucleotide-binding domain-containing protein [Candidatus Gracilibacteria bacterium]|nr:cyclic nucleotide-binding domain-containing protein [Candidatus Gracilibacteria bacterium]
MIQSIGMLSTLSQQDLENLSLFCQKKTVQRGEILFEQGDEANAMYILTVGEFEVYRTHLSEKQFLGEVHAEEVLGEMALFGESGKRMASARALVDSELVVLLDFSIKEMTEKYPELLQKLKEIIEIRNEQNKMKMNND